MGASGASGDPGGDVQDPVAERMDLAAGQYRGVVEGDQLGPGDQVDRGEHDLQPGSVQRGGVAGQVPQPGGLGLPDPVLDPGVLAVAQLQPGGLPGGPPRAACWSERR